MVSPDTLQPQAWREGFKRGVASALFPLLSGALRPSHGSAKRRTDALMPARTANQSNMILMSAPAKAESKAQAGKNDFMSNATMPPTATPSIHSAT